MATLIYSDKCKHCYELIEFIKNKPELHTVVQYHNVNQGVPQGVTRVPTLITSTGQAYMGKDVKAFLLSIAPDKVASYSLGGKKPLFTLGQNNNKPPIMTPDLQRKISRSIDEGLKDLQR